MQSKDLQYRTMRDYKGLVDHRADWGGKLVLLCGPGCALDGLPAAVSIAGGTTLAIDSDAAAMKSAMRAGYLDFVVNTLDEALRTLRNEVRQKRALSVGLIGDVNIALTEMVERGVQPDLWIAFPSHAARDPAVLTAFENFLQREISSKSRPEDAAPSTTNAVWRYGNPYRFAASNVSELRAIDEALFAVLPSEDLVRHRWIELVPKYLREARSGLRCIWLNESELQSLAQHGLSPAPQPSAEPKVL
jgi:urocanate hydratase